MNMILPRGPASCCPAFTCLPLSQGEVTVSWLFRARPGSRPTGNFGVGADEFEGALAIRSQGHLAHDVADDRRDSRVVRPDLDVDNAANFHRGTLVGGRLRPLVAGLEGGRR